MASVTDKPLVEAVLRRFGLREAFSAIVTTAEVGVGKHSPDVYLRAAERIGRLPEETLVFEDAPHALRTAREAGFPTFAVWDAASADREEELRALSTFYGTDLTDLSQLREML